MIAQSTQKRFVSFVTLFLLILSGVLPTAVNAQDDTPGLTVEVQAGFDGLYKGEYWFPVKVTVANDGPPIEGEIRVIKRDTIPDRRLVFRAPVSLPTRSNKEVTIYAYLPDPSPNLDIEVLDDDGKVLVETSSGRLSRVPTNDLFYGVVSPDPGEFSFLDNVPGGRAGTAVAFLTLNDLPAIPSAWNALDVLILNDVDTAQLNTDQLKAMDAWISTGGQLVITGGANWQKTTAALTDYLPVNISGSESVADLPGLAELIGQPFRDPGPYLMTTSSLASGTLLLHEGGLPLLAQKPYGRGNVYFLALDPRFAPLLDWDGTEQLFDLLAATVPSNSLWGTAPYEGYAANNAVSSLPQLNIPSVWQLLLFLLIYTAIVGPLNYFILKRRNHLERAWLTIPLLILGFTAVTYFTGFQIRGNEVLLNQLAVAYSQADGQQARVHSLIGLYSPRRDTYDLILPADTLARPLNNFIAGPGLRSLNNEAITFSNENSVDGVRVDVSDVETFTAQTDRPAPAVSGQAVLITEGSRSRLEAILQNNSNITLEDSVLFLGGNVIDLGDIEPGDSKNVNQIMTASGSGSSAGPFGPPNRLLTSHANEILGFNYYNDPVLYPRYQLLEALEGEGFSSTPLKLPANAVVLLAWSDQPMIDLNVDTGRSSQNDMTLHFIEIPLSQSVAEDTAVTVQPFQLDWSVLADSGIRDSAISNLRLNGGWVEFEFQPWADFQTMKTEELVIVLENNSGSGSFLAPEVKLWNWQEEIWQPLARVNWGRTAVADPEPFLGAGNTVRIRLDDRENAYSNVISNIYPSLTGSVE